MSSVGQVPRDMRRIELLIQEIDARAEPAMHASVVELLELLMDLYGGGIARMLEILRAAGSSGEELVRRFGQDDLVGKLLMLHNLHPVDLETRVLEALDKVRPLLASHGGDVSLLGMDHGVVQLRLEGNCRGCPSSTFTLKNSVEEAIYECAPDIAGLEVFGAEDDSRPSGFVPLEALRTG